MKYTKPSVERSRLVAHMINDPSSCEAAGGIWTAKGCDIDT